MRISKWGNNLVVRIPRAVVETLRLKEGDNVEIRVLGDGATGVLSKEAVQHALSRLRKLQRPLPPSFAFDREDANAR